MERRTTTILITILALVTFSTTIFAQGYWCNDYDYGMNWWNTDLPLQYQLSADQVVELNEYRANFNEKIIPLQKELRTLQLEMRGYVRRDNSDIEKVKEYRAQIKDLQDQIADIRIEAKQKMSSQFTNEQIGYFNNSRTNWWNGFYDRCGWDYDDITYDYNYGYNSGRAGYRGRGCW